MIDENLLEEFAADAERLRGIDWVFDDTELFEDLDHDEIPENDPEKITLQSTRETLLKGLLWHACCTTIDYLFEDLQTLHEHDYAPDAWGELLVLGDLPLRYRSKYTGLTARMFIVAVVDVSASLAGPWTRLPTVAHELALRLILNQVETIQENYEIELWDSWRSDLEEYLYEDLDHEWLYDTNIGDSEAKNIPGMGMAEMNLDSWFRPFGDDVRVSPYATAD